MTDDPTLNRMYGLIGDMTVAAQKELKNDDSLDNLVRVSEVVKSIAELAKVVYR